jgi:response regulator RpfG family c-di-GMP phosphodiesterase
MPEMDGFEVCRRLKSKAETRDVPVIFVSAASETSEKVQGFEIGAVDYVTKPYQHEELLARVHTHLELSYLRNHLEELVNERTAELKESEKKLRISLLDSIAVLASAVEKRDSYTAGHQRRVAHLAVAIGQELGLSEEQIQGIYLAGVVHDVGKIQVPSEILSKPGRLHELEFNLIKQHPKSGYEILETISLPWPIAQIVLQHHERMDGSGYPQGLKDDEILLESRIIAVADTVEAMASHRPYRPGLGVDAALEEIIRFRDTKYDAQVVDACVVLFRERSYAI